MAYNKRQQKTRQDKVKEATNKMQESIENYFTTPEQLKEYLSFMGQFYTYSPRNSTLIYNQFRGAEAVGSFKFWKEKGFSVQKGEKGIEILTPNKTVHKFKDSNDKWKNIKYATVDEREKVKNGDLEERKPRLYFTIGHVFDVSQTNASANDLPEIFPNRWLEGNVKSYKTMMKSYKEIAENMNVTVGSPLSELGSAKGAFYHGLDNETRGHIGLNPRSSQLQNVKTMAHELAHAKLHHGSKGFKLSDAEKEFQAEMVAYTVNDYFGIDTSEYSLKYLANWTKNKEFDDKMKLVEEVRETSVEFISKLEEDLLKEKEQSLTLPIELEQLIKENELELSSIRDYDDYIHYTLEKDGILIDINANNNNEYEIYLSSEESDFHNYYEERGLSIDGLNDSLKEGLSKSIEEPIESIEEVKNSKQKNKSKEDVLEL